MAPSPWLSHLTALWSWIWSNLAVAERLTAFANSANRFQAVHRQRIQEIEVALTPASGRPQAGHPVAGRDPLPTPGPDSTNTSYEGIAMASINRANIGLDRAEPHADMFSQYEEADPCNPLVLMPLPALKGIRVPDAPTDSIPKKKSAKGQKTGCKPPVGPKRERSPGSPPPKAPLRGLTPTERVRVHRQRKASGYFHEHNDILPVNED
ncbi:unnamed protein product, partial [Mesorhabditis spiculigera]